MRLHYPEYVQDVVVYRFGDEVRASLDAVPKRQIADRYAHGQVQIHCHARGCRFAEVDLGDWCLVFEPRAEHGVHRASAGHRPLQGSGHGDSPNDRAEAMLVEIRKLAEIPETAAVKV